MLEEEERGEARVNYFTARRGCIRASYPQSV